MSEVGLYYMHVFRLRPAQRKRRRFLHWYNHRPKEEDRTTQLARDKIHRKQGSPIGIILWLASLRQFMKYRTDPRPSAVNVALITSGTFHCSRNSIYLGLFLVVLASPPSRAWQAHLSPLSYFSCSSTRSSYRSRSENYSPASATSTNTTGAPCAGGSRATGFSSPPPSR